ncbi:MAG: hypothetical protein ABSE85_11015 [Candidatus Korobacteraceae bacterium]|jgi:hypothetical protein
MARKQTDLKALRNLIGEAHDLLRTTILPDERTERASKLLTGGVRLADALLEESPAAKRKRHGGGRPSNKSKPN